MEDFEKKYKEAMKACKELSDSFDNETLTEELEKIFPELKNSLDERIKEDIIDYLSNELNCLPQLTPRTDEIKDWITWVKKQPIRPQYQKLTELDKNIIEAAFAFVEQNNHFNCWRGITKHDVINALQSLRHQKKWKPSEEQIIALRWVLNNIPYNKHKEEISGLLDQIKDL